MNFLIEFLPVLLFFIAFKFYGIYVATVVGIVVTAIQLVIVSLIKRQLDKKQLITLIVFVVFGSMTLYFHNPIFIKWKPSIIFWTFGVILFFSHFIGKKPLMHRLLGNMLEGKAELSSLVWKKVNMAWSVFFILLGVLNIYIAYSYSTEAWVNFKFYGITILLFLFSIAQALYLARYSVEAK